MRYGLPDPDIETIFPSGPLPAQCPAGMVALGSYGSCHAWVGELRLDVLTVHLIAPCQRPEARCPRSPRASR